jgi:hypothetical protein
MNISSYNDNFDRQKFVNEADKQNSQLSAIQSLIIGKELDTQKDIPALKEIKCLNTFFEEPLNSLKETPLKKIFATATIAGMQKNILPFQIKDKTPEAIAATIDTGLTRAKIAYKTATGSLTPLEATDKLIDTLAARTVTVLDKVIDKGAPIVAAEISKKIAQRFPPAKFIRPVIEHVIINATPKIKEFVHKGVGIAALGAKTLVREKTKNVAKVGQRILEMLKI